MFIIGTIEDGGRCSSHPPRVVKTRKAKTPTKTPEADEQLTLHTVEPPRSAWDDLVAISSGPRQYQVQMASLYTGLQSLVRIPTIGGGEGSSSFTLVQFLPYEPANVRSLAREEHFELRAQSLVHLSPVEEAQDEADGATKRTESICIFLYEVGHHDGQGSEHG